MDKKLLGKFIKKRRMELQITQNEFAQMLNVTYGTVSKWENGRSYPDIELLEPIADALKVPIERLFAETKKEKNKFSVNYIAIFAILVGVAFLGSHIVKSIKERQNPKVIISGENIIQFDDKNTYRDFYFDGDILFIQYSDWNVDCYRFDTKTQKFIPEEDYKGIIKDGEQSRIYYYVGDDRAYGVAMGREDRLVIGCNSKDTAFLSDENNALYKVDLQKGSLGHDMLAELRLTKEDMTNIIFSPDASKAVVITTDSEWNYRYYYLNMDTGEIIELEKLMEIPLFDKDKSIHTSFSFVDDNKLEFIVSDSGKSVMYSYDFIIAKFEQIKHLDYAVDRFVTGKNFFLVFSEDNHLLSCISKDSYEAEWEKNADSAVLYKKENEECIVSIDKKYLFCDTCTGKYSDASGYYDHRIGEYLVSVNVLTDCSGLTYEISENKQTTESTIEYNNFKKIVESVNLTDGIKAVLLSDGEFTNSITGESNKLKDYKYSHGNSDENTYIYALDAVDFDHDGKNELLLSIKQGYLLLKENEDGSIYSYEPVERFVVGNDGYVYYSSSYNTGVIVRISFEKEGMTEQIVAEIKTGNSTDDLHYYLQDKEVDMDEFYEFYNKFGFYEREMIKAKYMM